MTTTHADEPILFGDGVHPTMATKVAYEWIPTGTRKPIATTASRTRMNLMGALDLMQMRLTVASFETLNSISMKDFFDKLKAAYPGVSRIHLIMDRGPYNISQETQKAAQESGIQVYYLLPYSPNLNPIARCWKVMNEHVRNNRFFKSAKEFRESIMTFFDTTWSHIAMDLTDRINDHFHRLKSVPSF